MDRAGIAALRLHNQFLSRPTNLTPAEIVRWQGAMQAQEFGPAKWSIGQRIGGCSEADVDRALDAGQILRTHALRPTWHFLAAEDIRWVLALTGPRVHQLSAAMYRRSGLDDELFARCHAVFESALAGGRHLTRKELAAHLDEAGIDASDGLRLGYIMMHAELEALVCSGPIRGKQQTYGLLRERVPGAESMAREEAVAELVRRYFTSHGPATANDFARWSGLTVADARQGIEASAGSIRSTRFEGRDLWYVEPGESISREPAPSAHLVQGYDEYLIGYGELREIYHPHWEQMLARVNPFLHAVVIDGQVAASWKRTIRKADVLTEVQPHRTLSGAEREVVARAAEAHGHFLGLPSTLTFSSM